MLNGLDLFSGIGGNTLALREWIRTVAYCEQDRHAQGVLLSRMADGSIEPAPTWDDVTTLQRSDIGGPIDIIVGGFPCQDISVAGNGAGLEGKRSGLVFEIFRLIEELNPAFVFLENVPAIRTRGGERVVKELAALGYDCRWDCLSAYDVGAPHKRERWFLLAHRNSDGLQRLKECDGQESEGAGSPRNDTDGLRDSVPNAIGLDLRDEQGRISGTYGTGAPLSRFDGPSQPLADADGSGLEVGEQGAPRQQPPSVGGGWWSIEPDVGRVAHGVPFRVDRLKRLGNGVVPAQAREAFRRLMGLPNA